MGWLFQILPFLVILFVVTSIIRSAAKMAGKPHEPRPDQPSPASYDPAEAERTRRIQEEIRRKIAERRGAVMAPVPAEPWSEPPVEEVLAPVTPSEEAPPAISTTAILERQQQLADQMRALEAARLSEQRKTAEISAVTAANKIEVASAAAMMRGALLADLRNPSIARRVMLLREVLGSPVALR